MDFQNEALKLEANQWSRITRSKYRVLLQLYLMRTLVLLTSAFLFSILVSLLTELSFLHSYTYSFSTFLQPLFTRILDRKCMFLLCNAIMAFLNVKSRLYSASSFEKEAEADDMPHYIMNAEHDMLLQPWTTVAEPVSEVESGTAASVSYITPQVMLTKEKQNKLLKDEIVWASQYQAGVEESCEQEIDEACDDVDIKDDEYGLTVGGRYDTETPTSTEELNKRIEKFIKKMKEDIRLEAQQLPPIAV